MATVYVSYRSTEEPFVRAVVAKLQTRHQIRIDLRLPLARGGAVKERQVGLRRLPARP